MEMLCDWNSFVAFHAGEVQATCAISSIVDLRNLHPPRWSWESFSTWKPSWHHRVTSIADSRRATRGLWRWVFIFTGLAASRVWHCWLQPCQRQDHLRLGCSEARAGNQSWEREEETASDRSCPCVACQQQFEDLLYSLVYWWLNLIGFKVYSTHWSCEGSSRIHAFPAQLKTWLSYKAYIALQVFRLIVLSCCEFIYLWIHIWIRKFIHMNSYTHEFIYSSHRWIHILRNSYIHLIDEFM